MVWSFVRESITRLFAITGLTALWHVVKTVRIMRGVDLVIASGGGQIDDYWGGPWRHPFALFKWAFIARATGARFALLSVGTCTISGLSRIFIRWALGLASYRSYRDQRSKAQLGWLSATRDDPVYPDLVFSYRPAARPHSIMELSRRLVAVSPIAYLSRHGWPIRDDGIADHYMNSLLGLCRNLAQEDYELLFFTSDSADLPVLHALRASLGDLANSPTIAFPPTLTVSDLITALAPASYVVASRLHAILIAHLLGRPALAISYDRKVDTHMQNVGMAAYCVDIHRLDTNILVNAFNNLVAQRQTLSQRLQATTVAYAEALEQQFTHILGAAPVARKAARPEHDADQPMSTVTRQEQRDGDPVL
jgi:polysaccharide pyruvyl transferase WcaK-like protein